LSRSSQAELKFGPSFKYTSNGGVAANRHPQGVDNGYAYIPYLPLLFALFILDNIIFGFGTNLATATYLQKIAVSREELRSHQMIWLRIEKN